MSSFFPPKAKQARAKGPKRKRKSEEGGAAPKRTEEQALLLLIKKATSVRRCAAPKAVDAEGKGEAAETEEDKDKACWTELKKMLRGGDETLARQAFGFLVGQLRDRRPEVRKRALLLLDRLVKRSATVRTELASNIRDVLDLTIGSSRSKLPGSSEDSAILKAKALCALEEWNETFGGQHPELRVAYRHLKDVVGAWFPNRQAVQEQEAHRLKAEGAERARSLAARYGAHGEAMRQGVQELRDVLGQMEACFDLIVPDMRKGLEALGEAPSAASSLLGDGRSSSAQAIGEGMVQRHDNNNKEEEEDDGDDDGSVEWESGDDAEGEGEGAGETSAAAAGLREEEDYMSDDGSSNDDERGEDEGLYGLGTMAFYEIEVDLPWLATGGGKADQQLETEDLKPVFDQLRELYGVLCGRLLPQAEQWWRLLAACCVHHPDTLTGEALESCRALMQEMGTLKSQAWLIVEKCKDIGGAQKKEQSKKKKRKKGEHRGGGAGAVLPAATLELESFLEETDAARASKGKM